MASVNDDQLCELEALKSIYPTELTVENETSPVRLLIRLGISEAGDEDEDCDGACNLHVELPAEYPEVVPVIDVSAEEFDISDEDLADVLETLKQLAVDNVGLPMVYTIATAAQEKLNSVAENMKQKRVDEETIKKAEADERDRRRLEGTPVTVENFLAWKTRFDEEMGRTKRVLLEAASRRLTGREQFLTDSSLCTSDIRLIEESGEEMKIDESLYDDADVDNELLSDDDEASDTCQRT